ncbi:alpha-mannosidase [Paenibacillus aquistagni]|uniref:alpha-mannosidase n=1 Tax=Paenibacillus aquistagni TaxID=1852522 RepID=UPI000B500E9D|nr:alpha-mannosidase [Paenibacillus aquistagni]
MERIQRWIKQLSQQASFERIVLDQWTLSRGTYVKPRHYEMEQLPDRGAPETMVRGEYGTTYLFETKLSIPKHWSKDAVGFQLKAGGEGLLSINGVPYHGLDRNHDFVLLHIDQVGWEPELRIELFDPIPEPIDPLNNQQVRQAPIQHIACELVHVNKPVESLLFTASVLRDTMRLLQEDSLERARIHSALTHVMQSVSTESERLRTDPAWVRELELELKSSVSIQGENHDAQSRGIMHMVGQSHIDVAWLWPIRETIRKCSRTFSTVMTLMDEYPQFQYAQSQPQLYAYVKEYYPELYARIKERVADGRWELVGGMWVEPDMNIPSGESLVRQLLYGQLFYEQEFGKRSSIEWVPDTFGYCASLPQLLKQAGMNYFMTSKLNWNDTNPFPYDLFHWVGIDGTSILSFLNHGLNEHTTPKDISEHWASYRQKAKHPEQMLLYGHGDGGGGVTRNMLEYMERGELMASLPEVRYSSAEQFFSRIGEDRKDLPSWHGDLYLELHRGTFTTHARNKRWNRKAEVLYREAEMWNSIGSLSALDGPEGARPALDSTAASTSASKNEQARLSLKKGWELMLLNQFHDIIPGTAITEVYETSKREYEEIFALGHEALEAGLHPIIGRVSAEGEGTPYVLFNSLGWDRDASVVIEGGTELSGLTAWSDQGDALICDYCESSLDEEQGALHVYVPSIPAFGYTTIWLKPTAAAESVDAGEAASASQSIEQGGRISSNALEAQQAHSSQEAGATQACSIPRWETPYYVMAFNERGEITQWYDKEAKRELVKQGEAMNVFQLFHDTPTYWDAWDIDPKYEAQPVMAAVLLQQELIVANPHRDVIRMTWKLHDSVITQDMILYKHSRVVDFSTSVDWKEEHKLLKVAFPVDVVATNATYEIPFGAIERPTHRNTSWQQAQYEVCGHRFADLSEGDYGVSLLNDCKYGYDVHGSTLRLSLLRAPRWPDASADQGQHIFTYSLYPHEGSWRTGGVVQKAMELNHPILPVKSKPGTGALPSTHRLIGYESKHVMLDTVKPAEGGDGIVLRLYEATGSRGDAVISGLDAVKQALRVNLLEDMEEELQMSEGHLALSFLPYEVKSIKLVSR